MFPSIGNSRQSYPNEPRAPSENGQSCRCPGRVTSWRHWHTRLPVNQRSKYTGKRRLPVAPDKEAFDPSPEYEREGPAGLTVWHEDPALALGALISSGRNYQAPFRNL